MPFLRMDFYFCTQVTSKQTVKGINIYYSWYMWGGCRVVVCPDCKKEFSTKMSRIVNLGGVCYYMVLVR